MHVNRAPGGVEMIDRLARAINEASEEATEAQLQKMRDEKLAVDTTHPPSQYRIAFLELLRDAGEELDGASLDMTALDRELEPLIAKQGDRILRDMKEASDH